MMRDEIREERKKLKGQGVKAHLSYFFTYYKVPFVIVLLAAIFAVYLVSYYTQKKTDVFGILFLNTENTENASTGSDSSGEKLEDFTAKVEKALGINRRKQEISLNASRYQTPGTHFAETDLATQTAILSGISTGSTDVLLMDAWNFNKYATGGSFLDLRNVLDENELSALSGKLYYLDASEIGNEDESYTNEAYEKMDVTLEEAENQESIGGFVLPDPSSMKDPVPVGILANDFPAIEKTGCYQKSAVILGVGAETKRKDMVREFVDFLQK